MNAHGKNDVGLLVVGGSPPPEEVTIGIFSSAAGVLLAAELYHSVFAICAVRCRRVYRKYKA